MPTEERDYGSLPLKPSTSTKTLTSSKIMSALSSAVYASQSTKTMDLTLRTLKGGNIKRILRDELRGSRRKAERRMPT